MSLKSLVWLGAVVGSTVGSFVPALFGQGVFSIASLVGSLVGGIAGIWMAVKLSNSL